MEIERGHATTPSSVVAREIVSFQSPFKLELLEFHRAIRDGNEPYTSARDGRRDIALCQNVIAAAVSGRPIPSPTAEVAR